MNLDLLCQLDVNDFTLEEVMAIFGWHWRWSAKLILSTGVRCGDFRMLSNGHYQLNRKAGAK